MRSRWIPTNNFLFHNLKWNWKFILCAFSLDYKWNKDLLFHYFFLFGWLVVGAKAQVENSLHENLSIAREVQGHGVLEDQVIRVWVQQHSHISSGNTHLWIIGTWSRCVTTMSHKHVHKHLVVARLSHLRFYCVTSWLAWQIAFVTHKETR